MKLAPCLLLLCLLAPACVDAESDSVSGIQSSLIGGEIDYEDEAAVSLNTPSSFSFCTGTLVSPQVVLTAAHCIDMAASDPEFNVFFGTDVQGEGRTVSVVGSRTHPEWTGELANGHDVGMVLLGFPQDPELPIPLNTSPVSDHIGDSIRRIGFGIYTVEGESDGRKRVGTTTITAVRAVDVFIAGDAELSTCSGDSGGPSLLEIDGVEYLAGVHSFGSQSNGQCIPGNDGDTRVDLYGEDFVLPWIQENDPACGEDGLCAKIGCIDDPDCEPCGADGTCTADCPLPDPDCPTSQLGEICQANTQCASGLCVYWRDDTKSKFCTRECNPAADDCPGGMSCQDFSIFGNVCYYDDAPDGVLGDDCSEATDCGSYTCEEGVCVYECNVPAGMLCPEDFECSSLDGSNYYCHALPKPEGCAISPGGTGDSGALWLLVLGAALVLRRRRR